MWHSGICYHSRWLTRWQRRTCCRRCSSSLRRLPSSRAWSGHPHAVHILSLLSVILTIILRLQKLSLHLMITLWIPVAHLLTITIGILSSTCCYLLQTTISILLTYYTHTHARARTHTHTLIFICINKYLYMHTYTYTCIYVYAHTISVRYKTK